MDSEKLLLESIGQARAWKPESAAAIAGILAKTREIAGASRLERFKSTQDFEPTPHGKPHELV
jgi:hypothetical protein